jgi:hypothetical protein
MEMPFAAVTFVNLQGRDTAAGVSLLNDVLIPRIKALPGFQAARFLRSVDGSSGVGSVIFDTESNARDGLDAMTAARPAEAPPVESTGIYEIVAEV